jgi:hypothetical protein
MEVRDVSGTHVIGPSLLLLVTRFAPDSRVEAILTVPAVAVPFAFHSPSTTFRNNLVPRPAAATRGIDRVSRGI